MKHKTKKALKKQKQRSNTKRMFGGVFPNVTEDNQRLEKI